MSSAGVGMGAFFEVDRRGGRRGAQRPVAVGVELGQLAVDVDGVDAVEVDVLVVAGPQVGHDLAVDRSAAAAQRRDGQPEVLGGPGDDRVGGQRQAPHLLGLLLVAAPPQRPFAGVGQLAAQRVQVLALVELAGDAPPVVSSTR